MQYVVSVLVLNCLHFIAIHAQSCTWTVSTNGALTATNSMLPSSTSSSYHVSPSSTAPSMLYIPSSNMAVEKPSVTYNETYLCKNCCEEVYNCVKCCWGIDIFGIPKPNYEDCNQVRVINCNKINVKKYTLTNNNDTNYNDVWQKYNQSEFNNSVNATSQDILFTQAMFTGNGIVKRIDMSYSYTLVVIRNNPSTYMNNVNHEKMKISLFAIAIHPTLISQQRIQLWSSNWLTGDKACTMKYVQGDLKPTGICSSYVTVFVQNSTQLNSTWLNQHGYIHFQIIMTIDIQNNIQNERSSTTSWYVHVNTNGIRVETSNLFPIGYPLIGASGIDTCNCDTGMCLLCHNGQYLDRHNNGLTDDLHPTACKACEMGQYSRWSFKHSASDRQHCISCPKGQYQNEEGQSECKYCGIGKYLNSFKAKNIDDCIACQEGKYGHSNEKNGGTSNEHCILCPKGRFNDNKGVTSLNNCIHCPIGQYGPLLGAVHITQCLKCSSGKYSNIIGITASEDCFKCSVGFFSNTMGASSCVWCVPGRYNNEIGQTSCKMCSPGKFSTYCSIYSAGIFGQRSTCEMIQEDALTRCSFCLAGFYSKASATTCFSCPAGTWSQSAQESCQPCHIGKYRSGSSTNVGCIDCPIGYTQTKIGQTSCDICSIGKYYSIDTTCKDCLKGWYQNEEGSNICHSCQVGTYSLKASKICIPCAMGRYSKHTSSIQCINCPSGFISKLGMVSCTSCLPGLSSGEGSPPPCTNCSSGRYRNHHSGPNCIACQAGTFSNIAASICIQCSSGKFAGEASSSCTSCEPGYFSFIGQTTCTACPNGYYSKLNRAKLCRSCTYGQYSTSASIKCKLCNSGMYSNELNQSNCKRCLIGQYAVNDGAIICIQCPSGYESINNGAEKCKSCVPGRYNNNASSSSSCQKCEIGQYAIDSGSIKCNDCSPGQVNTNEMDGSTCLKCASGYYSRNNHCVKCLKGTYNDEIGQNACKYCPVGWESKINGLSICDKCNEGQYTPSIHDDCQFCPSNWYQNEKASNKCIKCLTGLFSSSGARNKDACMLPSIVNTVQPPIIVKLYPKKSHLLELIFQMTNNDIKQSVLYVRVEWSDKSTFDKSDDHINYGSERILLSSLSSYSKMNVYKLYIPTKYPIVSHSVYIRIRYEFNTFSLVSKWSAMVPKWNIAKHCKLKHCCDDEHEYLRIFSNDNDQMKLVLPLYSHSRDESVRKCVTCPTGGNCHGSITSIDVVPKWGYWRIPWSILKFMQCTGKNDCIGAPGYNRIIIKNNVEENDNDIKIEYFLKECTPTSSSSSSSSSNLCGNNNNNNTSNKTQRIETCQLGRVSNSILCGVCSHNYIRSRNNCIKCYTSNKRIILLLLFVFLLIVIQLLYKYCLKKKLHKYEKASNDVLRIIIVNITLLQINNSLNSIIPIEWPDTFSSYVDSFQFVDVDLLSLSGNLN